MQKAGIEAKTLPLEELTTWLDNTVKPNTARVYLSIWINFYDWLQEYGPTNLRGMTPKEMVQRQKALNRAYILDEIMLPEKKEIIYAVLNYVNHGDNAKWRSKYKWKIFSALKSFFVYFLDKEGYPSLNNGEKNRLKGSPKTRKELKIEIVKAIIDNSNAMYKAVWSSMLASGMGIGETVKFSNQGIDTLRKAVAEPINSKEGDLIEIRLQARKENTENDFYVYVGGSALKYLKTYMKHREDMETRFNSAAMRTKRAQYYRRAGRDAPPLPSKFPDEIFVNNRYIPLTVKAAQFYWMSQLKQLKLWKSKGRKSDRSNMNIHQIRSIFRTRAHKSDADRDILEYFLGHEMDPLDYNQIDADQDYRIQEYLKAQSWLDIEKINIERQTEESGAQMRRIEELEAQLDVERRKKRETDIEFRDLEEKVNGMDSMLQRFAEKEREVDRVLEPSREPEDARAR